MATPAAVKDAELKRITDRIGELCEAHQGQGTPYLLSRLGLDLGKDAITLKYLGYPKLAQFVTERLVGRCELRLLGGRHNNIYAIFPTGAPSPTPLTPSFLAKRPRYHYRFWAAFSVPALGERRDLNLLDFTFRDAAASEPAPPGTLPIEPDVIAPDNVADRDNTIHTNIDRWLERHGLERSKFLVSEKVSHSSNLLPSDASATLLDLLLTSLDNRQLQRISLPLDVISSLLRTRAQR
ncbi:MAG: hypothetical protein HYR63_28990 [Proteobacteria bacterium]|nr:hypothetical protein [Pseudomonadota bacterium]